jgi:hypothetical protein
MSAFWFPLALASLLLMAAPSKTVPDLSGTWQINEDLSQTPQQAMRQSGEDRPSGPRGGPGGMGRPGRRGGGFPGGGGGGEGFPGGPGGGPPPEGRHGFEEAAADTMTIAWSAPQLTITTGDRKRVLWTDGRKLKEETPDGKTIKTRTSWTDDGSLEVVTKMDNGLTRTEIFELTHDGRRLFVLNGLEGRGPRPIQFRRVYDRVEEEKKGAPEPSESHGHHKK